MAGTPSPSPSPSSPGTRVARASAARLGYGTVQLLLARRLARSLVGAGPSPRWLIRAAGVRHVAQAAAVAVLRSRGHQDGARALGAAADLAQAAVLAAGPGRRPRWATAASLDRLVGAGLAYADLMPPRQPDGAAPTAEDGTDREEPVRHDTDLDVPPKRPDPFAYPVGPTVEESEAAGIRHEQEIAVQQIVQELVATCDGHPVDEVLRRLQQALADQRLGPYPRTWLEAIARDAAAGRTYVVTKVAAEKSGIPEPLPGPPTAGVV